NLALQTAAPEARVGLFATGAPGRRTPPRPVPTAVSARKPLAPRRSNVALLLTGPPKQGSSHGPARSHPPLLRRRRGRRAPGPAGGPRRVEGPPQGRGPVVRAARPGARPRPPPGRPVPRRRGSARRPTPPRRRQQGIPQRPPRRLRRSGPGTEARQPPQRGGRLPARPGPPGPAGRPRADRH